MYHMLTPRSGATAPAASRATHSRDRTSRLRSGLRAPCTPRRAVISTIYTTRNIGGPPYKPPSSDTGAHTHASPRRMLTAAATRKIRAAGYVSLSARPHLASLVSSTFISLAVPLRHSSTPRQPLASPARAFLLHFFPSLRHIPHIDTEIRGCGPGGQPRHAPRDTQPR